MSCEGVEQNLNTDQCSFGSHNYITDSSHSDDLHQLNDQFMTPSNTDHVREQRAVACIASLSPKLGSDDSELSLEGVS